MLKETKDYMQELQTMYPSIDYSDIKKIVEYGWRMLYYYNLRGCDTVIQSNKNKYWFYIGELTKNSLKHYDYYKRMLRRKLRVLYRNKKFVWDGYYYTGLTEEEYNTIVSKNKGRKKINFSFDRKIMFKIKDEARLFYDWAKCIIKFKYPADLGYSFFKSKLKCKNIEPIIIRDKPSTFSDILISKNKYELI